MDPEAWLVERFNEDPRMIFWDHYGSEYDNHKWDGTKNPLAAMWFSVIKNQKTGLASGTGTGKTYCLSRIAYWWLDCWENSVVHTSAPKEKMLELQLWAEMTKCFHKFKAIRPNAEMTHLKVRVDAKNQKYKESWTAQAFIAGVRANEESTTKAQGLHGDRMLIICEETPGMPWPTMNAFINTSTGDNNRLLALGNPDSITDTLSMFIRSDDDCVSIRASALDHPNIVLGKEVIPGAVGRKSVESRRKTYGEDNFFYKSRIRGIFPEQAKDSLIRLEWLQRCWKNSDDEGKARNPNFKAVELDDGFNAAGVDVANSDEGDKGAVAYGNGNTLKRLVDFRCPNATHLAYNLIYTPDELQARKYGNYGIPTAEEFDIEAEDIGIDVVGVGAATINAFKDLDLNPVALQGGQDEALIPKDADGEPLFNFNSLRAQMYWLFAQALMHGRVVLDIPADVFKELCDEAVVPKYKNNLRTISVESKEDIKKRMGGKSPNRLDAVVYWYYTHLGSRKGNNGYAPML